MSDIVTDNAGLIPHRQVIDDVNPMPPHDRVRVISRDMDTQNSSLDQILKRIDQRLAELRMSAREASLAAGNADMIAGIRRGYKRGSQTSITMRNLHRLAEALGTSSHWLMTGEHESPQTQDEPSPQAGPATRPLEAFHKDLPVIGTAAGSILRGVTGLKLVRTPLDYILRPPVLAGVPNAYAVRVTGTSMEPTLRPGDICIVDPNKAPTEGDLVIVQTQHYAKDPGQSYVKFLESRSESSVTLFQTNPHARIEVPTIFISSIHRVMRMVDVFSDN